MLTADTITLTQIDALAGEATDNDDPELAETCERASSGNHEARGECAAVINFGADDPLTYGMING
jgi:hypothetical protein